MVEEAKKPDGGNGKLKTQAEIEAEKKPQVEIKKGEQKGQGLPPPKEVKIAEIWIKNGEPFLDACPNFWMDQISAVGILEYCKDIVKQNNPMNQNKKLISGSAVNQAMNTMNRLKNRITGAFGGGKKG